MKIILLISSMGAGGAERVAATLCNAWAKRSNQVTLISTFSGGGKSFYDISKNIELIFLADLVENKKKSFVSSLQRLYILRRLISIRQADVIVSFLSNVNIAAVIASAFLKSPLIICERSDPSSQPVSRLLRVACKLTYRYADMLTVQTDSVVKKVDQIYSGIKLLRAIPNPLPDAIVSIKKNLIAKRRKSLLSLGRLSDEKQVELIIAAFAKLAFRCADWDLHVYGDGPLKNNILQQIASLDMQNRIFLKGRTSEPWQIMANADAYVMASRFEGFPNALLEAMGVGLPCVAFDCPSGPREISNDGKDALLVDLNDQQGLITALEKVMSDEVFRDDLGNRARKSVLSRYSLASILNRWDELFQQVGVAM
ncbi:glycosyltransferase family 4 protein [Polaromonas sp.]|uniref:glycosyltransferase family 4 protein n=1 Tax=Polaromonas sp. TaxID=1869339 RepID=UPI0013BDE953|nr:glycosyltransferase family 4 protein [Polaromonas sp.]NDP61892.1 glycosyltransferase family 4 protein [Polaromonas sp.]